MADSTARQPAHVAISPALIIPLVHSVNVILALRIIDMLDYVFLR
jgi:hypothetical protein